MDHSRSHAGPMDFEYQNGTGPLDARSPFAQVSGNHQPAFGRLVDEASRKGGLRTAFGSPPKPTPSTQRGFQSQAPGYPQSKPASPIKGFSSGSTFSLRPTSIFSTPRRSADDAASSGGETPRSPEQSSLIDSDATPDNHSTVNFRNSPVKFSTDDMPIFSAGDVAQAKLKEKGKDKDKRRDSWWSRAAGLVSSPGRGEVPRGLSHDKITKQHRPASKKRRGDGGAGIKQLVRLRNDSISDSEDSRPPSPSKSKKKTSSSSISCWARRKSSSDSTAAEHAHHPPAAGKGSLASFFEFLTAHPTLPQILSWYAQLTLNFFLISSLMYILYSFYATIRSDIDKKSSEAVAELMAEMAGCARQYTENRCAPETRVPAMQTVCENWEKCMRQDAKRLGRAKISVGMWAEIFNGFVEPISWKAMIFTVVMIFGAVALSNLPFSMIRHRADQAQATAAANHHHYYGAPPATPHRQFSGGAAGGVEGAHFWQAGLEPAPSAAPGMIEAYGGEGVGGLGAKSGRSSPVKQLHFR